MRSHDAETLSRRSALGRLAALASAALCRPVNAGEPSQDGFRIGEPRAPQADGVECEDVGWGHGSAPGDRGWHPHPRRGHEMGRRLVGWVIHAAPCSALLWRGLPRPAGAWVIRHSVSRGIRSRLRHVPAMPLAHLESCAHQPGDELASRTTLLLLPKACCWPGRTPAPGESHRAGCSRASCLRATREEN